MSITHKPYGLEQHGAPVTEYTLTNAGGAYVSILDFGGIITRIAVPDRQGALADVNLGFDEAIRYTKDHGSMGALIGRVGNRIANAEFALEGKTYALGANNGVNNLHGGPEGFNLRMWAVTPEEGETADALHLTLTSPNGDQGFPGKLTVQVTYTFDAANTLGIAYIANTDQTTLVNLTNHAYFNLDGHAAPDVRDLTLQVFADSVNAVREGLIPTGKLVPQTDVVYGFASSGLHSNGYSLARKVLLDRAGLAFDATPEELDGRNVGAAMLEPTRIYVALMAELKAACVDVRGCAHITGGGLPGNLNRCLPKTVDAKLFRDRWQVPGIFQLIQKVGPVETPEMMRTFNMGIGYCVVAPAVEEAKIRAAAERSGDTLYVIGEVIPGNGNVQIEQNS